MRMRHLNWITTLINIANKHPNTVCSNKLRKSHRNATRNERNVEEERSYKVDGPYYARNNQDQEYGLIQCAGKLENDQQTFIRRKWRIEEERSYKADGPYYACTNQDQEYGPIHTAIFSIQFSY